MHRRICVAHHAAAPCGLPLARKSIALVLHTFAAKYAALSRKRSEKFLSYHLPVRQAGSPLSFL